VRAHGPEGTVARIGAQAARSTVNVVQTRVTGTTQQPSIKHPAKLNYVHDQDLLLVTDAGLVTVIIGLAINLILIVIGSFFKKKIQL